jgi:hypothetical protein
MHYGKPTEPVWSNLKRSLANLTKHDIGQLTALVKTRLRRMQYRPGLRGYRGTDARQEENPGTGRYRLAVPRGGQDRGGRGGDQAVTGQREEGGGHHALVNPGEGVHVTERVARREQGNRGHDGGSGPAGGLVGTVHRVTARSSEASRKHSG